MSSLLKPMKERGLIPFVMAGFPDQATSLRIALALLDEGAVALEIGVPFSDPMADGPVIQLAASRALTGGASLRSTLGLVSEIKRQRSNSSIVLFTYLNPLLRMGLKGFTTLARDSGVDATLVVDLPPEEATEHVKVHRAAGLGTIFLASPTSSVERLGKIAAMSSGFIYGVARVGTTGEVQGLSSSLASEIKTLRVHSAGLPVAVGFGVANAEQAAEVARLADSVVIGSRFVSLIQNSETGEIAERAVRTFARSCVQAIRAVHEGAEKKPESELAKKSERV